MFRPFTAGALPFRADAGICGFPRFFLGGGAAAADEGADSGEAKAPSAGVSLSFSSAASDVPTDFISSSSSGAVPTDLISSSPSSSGAIFVVEETDLDSSSSSFSSSPAATSEVSSGTGVSSDDSIGTSSVDASVCSTAMSSLIVCSRCYSSILVKRVLVTFFESVLRGEFYNRICTLMLALLMVAVFLPFFHCQQRASLSFLPVLRDFYT
jgi:hypothetical protein